MTLLEKSTIRQLNILFGTIDLMQENSTKVGE